MSKESRKRWAILLTAGMAGHPLLSAPNQPFATILFFVFTLVVVLLVTD